MLKLLTLTLLLNSILGADQNKVVEEYLEEVFSNNPNVSKLSIKVVGRLPVESMKGWDAVVVNIDATVTKPALREVKQKMIWFTNGDIITKELTNMKSGDSLKDMLNPPFKAEYYKKENLIYGDADAKHKVVIFSDPLCPFCRKFVPHAINEMKSKASTFAIYYFHFPLPSLHPAAIELSQDAIAAELKGCKDIVLNMYKVEIDPKERDVKKILKAFNKVMKTNITPADLKSKAVQEQVQSDIEIADGLMVRGTPTVFLDGKIDRTKRKYQKVK